ncbi:MAG: hypothetical protein CM15mP74_30650 [Halieaceae bacterium]|nr:MAG: hypothetical protein CM15mP74_30650 [Halieaceae bacterium]
MQRDNGVIDIECHQPFEVCLLIVLRPLTALCRDFCLKIRLRIDRTDNIDSAIRAAQNAPSALKRVGRGAII